LRGWAEKPLKCDGQGLVIECNYSCSLGKIFITDIKFTDRLCI
jgi:hypothetical protein